MRTLPGRLKRFKKDPWATKGSAFLTIRLTNCRRRRKARSWVVERTVDVVNLDNVHNPANSMSPEDRRDALGNFWMDRYGIVLAFRSQREEIAMAAAQRVLTDHEDIRRWAESRQAKPAAVQKTEREDDPGILRLDFPGYTGEGSLEPISWDDWFEKFDESNLALIVQDQTADGQRSNFNKLVHREQQDR
jgi:hypothetical protein